MHEQPAKRENTPRAYVAGRLLVLSGLHAGADRELRDGELLLLGSDLGCDLILSDDGVSQQQLVVSKHGEKLKVKVLGSGVERVGRGPIPCGQTLVIDRLIRLRIAGLVLAVGDIDDPGWDSVELTRQAHPEHTIRSAWPGQRLVWLGLVGALLIVAGAGLSIALERSPQHITQTAISDFDRVAQLIDKMGLDEIELHEGEESGVLTLTGIAPSSAMIQELESQLRMIRSPVRLELRSGAGIAEDLRSVLRLPPFNLQVDARYAGAGEVRIRGYFNDDQRLHEALGSPSVAAIAGLDRVSVDNLATGEPEIAPTALAFRAVREGEWPYLLTTCGLRFFLGAEVPGFGQLVHLEGQTVMFRDGEEIKTVDLSRQRASS
ncbi:MAG: FHA domain-containing protein [Wenzhouxiangella sp.]